MTGRLIGVGVGPGDPGLLTLKAIEALNQADVVAHFAKAGNASNARTIVAAHLNGAEELPLLYPVTTEIPKEDAAYRDAIRAFYDAAARDGRHASRRRPHGRGDRPRAIPCSTAPTCISMCGSASRYPTEIVAGVTGMSGCWSSIGAPIDARRRRVHRAARHAARIRA